MSRSRNITSTNTNTSKFPGLAPSAVILDFDGVILDSLPAHLSAWRAAAGALFNQALPSEESLIGHSTRTIAHILCRRYGAPERVQELVAAKDRFLAERFQTLELLPGVRDFLQALSTSGLPYGIASNARRRFVTGALAAASLHVPVVLTADDVSRPKPAPDIYWDCANRLGIAVSDRARVLIFEDSVHGLKAGVAAGMIAIGVTTDTEASSLLAAGARACCANLGEALARQWLTRLP